MPPYTSHILQPLDVGVFSTLKRKYRTEIANLSSYIETTPIQRRQFIDYYAKARQIVLTSYYIDAGWRGTGLNPYDPNKVLFSSQVVSSTNHLEIPPQTPSSNRHK